MENYLLFIVTAMAAAILPGADFAVVTKNTLAAGKYGGQATAIGVGSGLLIHTSAAVLGLAAIIAKSAMLFEFIKYIGAAYLFYLGLITIIVAKRNVMPLEVTAGETQLLNEGFKKYYLQGMLTNALNPKAAIFYLTLLPQFVTVNENYLLQLTMLGLTAVFIVMGWFCFLAFALDNIRQWFNKPMFKINFQRVTGLMLLSCGIKLALVKY